MSGRQMRDAGCHAAWVLAWVAACTTAIVTGLPQ
jgi:hypothetical protein